MTESRKNIDRLFRDRLNGYKEKAPVNTWTGLNDALDQSAKRKSLFYFRLIAASVIIFLAFGAGYFYAVHFTGRFGQAGQTVAVSPDNGAGSHEGIQTVTSVDQKQDISSTEPIENGLAEIMASKPSDQNTDSEIFALKQKNSDNENISYSSLDLSSDQILNNRVLEGELHHLPFVGMGNVKVTNTEIQLKGIRTSHLFVTMNTIEPVSESPDKEPVVTFGYDNPPEDARRLKWTIGAQLAPTVSYRDLSTNYGDNPSQVISEENHLNDSEESLLAYSGGVQVDLALNKKWGFQSGLYYSRIGQVNNDALEYTQEAKGYILSAVNTSAGEVNVAYSKVPKGIRNIESVKKETTANQVVNARIIQNFDLFEVPFLVNYHLLNKKFSIKVSGGLSPAYLVDNKTLLELDNESYDIGNTANLSNILVNSTIGMGIGYELFKRLALSFEPTFKYSLNPINKGNDFDYHPYYMSWFTGLKYSF